MFAQYRTIQNMRYSDLRWYSKSTCKLKDSNKPISELLHCYAMCSLLYADQVKCCNEEMTDARNGQGLRALFLPRCCHLCRCASGGWRPAAWKETCHIPMSSCQRGETNPSEEVSGMHFQAPNPLLIHSHTHNGGRQIRYSTFLFS